MARQVTHFSKVTQRRDTTVTGTLCNRMTVGSDGMNLSTDQAEVTCKFCLKLLAAFNKRRAA